MIIKTVEEYNKIERLPSCLKITSTNPRRATIDDVITWEYTD